jgi:hypothetical protein
LTLKSQQLAFFAQDELVSIIPNRHMHVLHFLNVRTSSRCQN